MISWHIESGLSGLVKTLGKLTFAPVILHIRNNEIIAYRAKTATPPHIKVNKTIPSCAIAYESPKIPDPRIALIKLNTDNANPAFPVPLNEISFHFYNSDYL